MKLKMVGQGTWQADPQQLRLWNAAGKEKLSLAPGQKQAHKEAAPESMTHDACKETCFEQGERKSIASVHALHPQQSPVPLKLVAEIAEACLK